MGEGRVLIIEDEAMVSMMIADLVGLTNGRVVGLAETVDEGLDLVDNIDYDIVILDVSLNGQSSEPIAKRLRENGTPVVVATGAHVASLPAAFSGYPVALKPFRASEVMDFVEQLAF